MAYITQIVLRDDCQKTVSKTLTQLSHSCDHSGNTWWPLGDHLVTTWWPHGNHMEITLQTLGDLLVITRWILLVGDHFVTVGVMCKSSTRVCINSSIISVGVLRYYPSIQLAKIIRVHITNEDHLVTTLWLQGDQLTAWQSLDDHLIAKLPFSDHLVTTIRAFTFVVGHERHFGHSLRTFCIWDFLTY